MRDRISSHGLHGRDDVLAWAARPLAAARAGEGRLLLVSGEAGVGKTRLLRELQGAAGSADLGLWAAAAHPQDVELPGGLLLDLGHALSRSDRSDVAARGRRLVLDLAEAAVGSPDSGDAHRRRRLLVLDVVDRLLSLSDDGPALLALEDLHWCDQLSLEVVEHLARRLDTLLLLVVGTLRTDELLQDAPARGWRARLLLQRVAEEVRLEPLAREHTERMVHELLGGGGSRRLAALVHRRSGGVPLHVEELVTAAALGHRIASSGYVPQTLADAVLQRFGSLSHLAREIAVAAAVVQRSFDLGLLTAVAGRAVEEAVAGLDELVDRHFVHEESPAWFGFRHALIRDAVAANASLGVRRVLHARVAAVARQRPELGATPTAPRTTRRQASSRRHRRPHRRPAHVPPRCLPTGRPWTCSTAPCGACRPGTTARGSTSWSGGPPRRRSPTTTSGRPRTSTRLAAGSSRVGTCWRLPGCCLTWSPPATCSGTR